LNVVQANVIAVVAGERPAQELTIRGLLEVRIMRSTTLDVCFSSTGP
jgi:hypothetical protein